MKSQQKYVMPEDVHLQRATEKDMETVAKMEKSAASDLFFPLTDKKEIRDYIKNSVVYIINYKNKAVGTASYEMKTDGVVYFNGLIVLPEYQFQGIAKIAMKHVLSELSDKKLFELSVHPKNTPALLLYLKLGFTVDTWKDNFFGDGTPRLILKKYPS